MNKERGKQIEKEMTFITLFKGMEELKTCIIAQQGLDHLSKLNKGLKRTLSPTLLQEM